MVLGEPGDEDSGLVDEVRVEVVIAEACGRRVERRVGQIELGDLGDEAFVEAGDRCSMPM